MKDSDKKKIKTLEAQDKELAKLPSMEKEKRFFKKEEKLLDRMVVKKKVKAKMPKKEVK